MEYKVLIPSAGLGTRLGKSYKNVNKALVSVDNKPVISHIIEKFSTNITFVIALGHKGSLLKDYLDLAHQEYNFEYVFIDKYFGKGSGLGYSILQCRNYLNCPFVFAPNDALVTESIPIPDENWLGYGNIELEDDNYRSLTINENRIVKILEKGVKSSNSQKPYIGLAGINNYKKFWEYMDSGKNYGSISIGESYAIDQFLKNSISIKGIPFTWYDTGNISRLNYARNIIKSPNSPEILDKPNEAIWFISDKVIKYNDDKKFISNRVKRSKILSGYVPEIIGVKENMYAYKHIAGKTLSKVSNKNIFISLTLFLDKFWTNYNIEKYDEKKFHEACLKFYKDKTYQRVQLFFNRFLEKDSAEIVNGCSIPSINELLNRINWDELKIGVPRRIHGDLHFENILSTELSGFSLLDWRQDFSGIIEYGDLYYDFSKLLHGLIISHELINKNHFYIEKNEDIINFGFYRKNSLVENECDFFDFLISNDFDVFRVKLLTALIFINISPLHHEPYCKLLYYLGKYNLYRLINENPNNKLIKK